MRDAPRLFCLDTVLIDVVLKVGALPERGGDVLARDHLFTTGGGFNAMSAAARHDLAVVYAGRLGSGPFAELAMNSLDVEGISAPLARHPSLDTGVCVVLVEPDGERSFVTAPGAEGTLRAEDLASLAVESGDLVLISGYNVMYPGYADLVLNWVHELSREVVVVFDPATRMVDIPASNLAAMLERANWLLCNAAESRALTRDDDAALSALALAQRYEGLDVVVRDGARGCVVVVKGERTSIAGFSTDVVDTNGAGDVHNGVFLAELASGHSPLDAARWANAAAALAIAELGPATGPTRARVAAWLNDA